MPKRLNPRLIKIHHTRTVEEWAAVLGVHKNTIFRMIKNGGLEAITDQRPWLIRGAALRSHLEARASSRKIPVGRGEMACFGCRRGRKPAGDMLDYIPLNPVSGRLQALCPVCGSLMNRAIRFADIQRKFPDCDISITKCLRPLTGLDDNPVNCDKNASGRTVQSDHPNIIKFPKTRSA